ncbi:MAG: MATE family efflux transporter [Ruminococcaceae bacterium]|nr:MATE family efflux transporter [Oscillospiraceae bacterium]
MQKNDKTYLFERAPVPKAVMTLAIPGVLSSLVTVLYNLADTFFVSMLGDAVQNSAVTLAAPVMLAFNAVNNLFGVGSSSMMSRAMGRKDMDTVRRSSAFGFYCALCCGLLFSLLVTVFFTPLLQLLGADATTMAATAEYMHWTVRLGAAPAILNVVMAYLFRAEGAALHASIGTMSGCVLNIILDPIFILPWGLNMGAAGAGCATFVSNCVACTYFLVLVIVRRGRTMVCISPKMFSFRRDIVRGVCGVGVPASIQNLLNVVGMTVLNNFTASYEATAVAAMGIAHKIAMVPMYVSMGIGQATMPLIGYNYASGNHQRMKHAFTYTTKVALAFQITVTTVCCLFPATIVGWFMKDAQIVALGAVFLCGQILAQPFLCMDFLAVGVFQSCGMGGRSLVFAVLRKVVLEIPALFILGKLFPLYGLAYAQLCAEFVLAVVAVLAVRKIFRDCERKAGLQMM